jgi:large-conductance mechanosensitive channel
MNADALLSVAGFLVMALTIGFIFVLRKTKANERRRELEAQQQKAGSEKQD